MRFVVVAAGLLLACGVGAQQSMPQRAAELGVDALPSFPQEVVIEAVDRVAGEVRIGGQRYRYAASDPGSLRSPRGDGGGSDSLQLDELKSGMTVMIQTDGTEPSERNRPLILRVWIP
jgi:hypothetical protein